MIYLASPYSGTPEQQEARHAETLLHVVAAIRQRIPVFSPITTWHEIAKREGLPGDADFWWGYNENMLLRADILIMLMIDGADKSKGMQMEYALAKDCGTPVIIFMPDPKCTLEEQWANLGTHILRIKELMAANPKKMARA